MNATLESIEQAAKQLSLNQRAALAHTLIKDLDDEAEGDERYIETLWAAEAEDRLDAYLHGEIEASPMSDVVERVRANIRDRG